MKIANWIRVMIFSVFLFLGSLLSAQTITISSLDEAVKLALKQNLDYQNYLLNEEKAEIEYKQSKNYKLPTVSGVFNGQRNIELPTTPVPGEFFMQPGTIVDAQFGQEYNYNAGISIQKDVFNQERKLQSKISKLSQQNQTVSKEIFEDFIKEQVSLYYYTSLVAKRAIEIGEKDLESSMQIENLTQGKFDEGLVDAITLNTAKINTNAVKQSFNANKQLEIQCLSELKKLIGLGYQDSLNLTGIFDYFMPQVYDASQLKSSRNVESAQLQLEQAEIGVKKSQASLFPTLSLNSYHGSQQFRDDFGLSLNSNSWTGNSYLTLNLTVPIFTGFNNRRDIKKSKLDHQVAYNQKVKAVQYEELEDQRLLADYRISIDDAQASQETYQLYKENHKLSFEKYEEGLISLDNYLKVFEDYFKAENAYLNNLTKVYSYYSQILPRVQ